MESLRETPITAGLGHPEQRRLAGLCEVRKAELAALPPPGRQPDHPPRNRPERSNRVATPGSGPRLHHHPDRGAGRHRRLVGHRPALPCDLDSGRRLSHSSRILTINAVAARRSLRDDPALAATVYPRVLEAVARRMGATRHQLLDLYARESERAAVMTATTGTRHPASTAPNRPRPPPRPPSRGRTDRHRAGRSPGRRDRL